MRPGRGLSAFTFVWFVACTGTAEVEPPVPLNDRPACLKTITLDSSSNDRRAIGPRLIDEDGVTICLRLDARRTRRSALMAYTANESQASPSFTIALFLDNGRSRVEGWEVPMAGPTSSAHVEWNTEVPGIYDLVLRVAARPRQARTTTIHIAFFDPLE